MTSGRMLRVGDFAERRETNIVELAGEQFFCPEQAGKRIRSSKLLNVPKIQNLMTSDALKKSIWTDSGGFSDFPIRLLGENWLNEALDWGLFRFWAFFSRF